MQTNQFKHTGDFISEAHRLIDRIAQNNRVWEEKCVKFFGVTPSQGGTILSLSLENPLKMNELSNVVGVDNSTMTRMVDQLVEKGLVLRKAGDKDRRLVQIGLTLAISLTALLQSPINGSIHCHQAFKNNSLLFQGDLFQGVFIEAFQGIS